MTVRTYLNVPFAEKDDARELGARWDPDVKRWYAPEGIALHPFARWHADTVADAMLMVAPILLLQAWSNCWKCKGRSPVFCLACSDVRDTRDDRPDESYDGDLLLISDVTTVDERILRHLRRRAPDYRPDWSATKGSRCWMNHCRDCGAKMGDFHLHSEPGGPFFCITSSDWNRIRQHLLERDGAYDFDGSYSL